MKKTRYTKFISSQKTDSCRIVFYLFQFFTITVAVITSNIIRVQTLRLLSGGCLYFDKNNNKYPNIRYVTLIIC